MSAREILFGHLTYDSAPAGADIPIIGAASNSSRPSSDAFALGSGERTVE
jgi:hypothetical protein